MAAAAGAQGRWADLGPRLAVLAALSAAVLAPAAMSAAACVQVFRAAATLAALEWARAAARSPAAAKIRAGAADAGDWAALAFAAAALAMWAPSTMASIPARIEGECPGHRRTIEAVVVVLLVSDSAQLAFGRKFGRTKFLPKVSPNKSLEGYVGGLLVTLLYAWAAHGWPVSLTAPVFVAGVAGDLAFSLAKRIMGTKDFSGLLGPHGGVCDRIDSFLGAWTLHAWISCPSEGKLG